MMVFLDIGSTLMDGPAKGPAQRLREMLDLGQEQVATIAHTLFATPSTTRYELARILADRLNLSHTMVLEAVEQLWCNQLEETYVLPDAQSVVGMLAAANISRAYLSNIWPPFFEGFVRHFPIEARQSPCYLSFQMGLTKPDPQFFRTALADQGIAPQDSIMIGDTYQNDIAPAIALGIKTVWVLTRPAKERKDIVQVLNGTVPAPNLTIASIGDLTLDHLRVLQQ